MSLIFAAALFASQVAEPSSLAYGFPDGDTPTIPSIENRLSSAFRKCVCVPNFGPLEKNNCIAAENMRQDHKLNATYQRVMLRLKPERRIALRNAERAWIKDAATYCRRVDSKIVDGSDSGCMLDETIRRTIWLEHLR